MPQNNPPHNQPSNNGDNGGLRWYVTREPLVLLFLSAIAVVFFSAVAGLSTVYHRQQEQIANRYYSEGQADLKDSKLDLAIREFRAALAYSRGNFLYRLSLAQALAAQHRFDEASGYLDNLWQQRPNNGTVNLELARVYATNGDPDEASRYYHNAVYAVWDSQPDERRREVRLELIKFLLNVDRKPDADAELIALSANLPATSPLHSEASELFMQARDYEHAFAEYRQALRINHHDPAAQLGAGRAAFELRRYTQAQTYLRNAVTENPSDTDALSLFEKTSSILGLDPFRRDISLARRYQIVQSAFAIAGERLKICEAKLGPMNTGQASVEARWSELKSQVSVTGLRRNPDLADEVMDFVFTVEDQLSTKCGPPTGKDEALILVGRLREGN